MKKNLYIVAVANNFEGTNTVKIVDAQSSLDAALDALKISGDDRGMFLTVKSVQDCAFDGDLLISNPVLLDKIVEENK